MTDHNFDDLEMQLRVLGRQLGEDEPGQALVRRTTDIAAAQLAGCTARNMQRRRRLLTGTLLLVAATLPIPLLFLWGDWTATSALFDSFLSPAASEVASSIYLWMKLCALSLIYLIATPTIAVWAVRVNGLAALQPEARHA